MNTKKTLTKVRRQFLHREPDENRNLPPDNLSQSFDIQTNDIIKENLCFKASDQENDMTKQLKVLFGDTSDLTTDICNSKRLLSSNLCQIDENIPLFNEKLEMESLTADNPKIKDWIHKVNKIYASYLKKAAQYQQLLGSSNPTVCALFRKMKLRAVLACKDTERSYPYKKVLILLKNESMEVISSSYNQGFLNEFGYTFEDFSLWTKEDGTPVLLDKDISRNSNTPSQFLDSAFLHCSPVQQGSEYIICVSAKEDSGEKMIVQDVYVFEPISQGMFVSIYLIIKGRALVNNNQKRMNKFDTTEDEFNRSSTKCSKKENLGEINQSRSDKAKDDVN